MKNYKYIRLDKREETEFILQRQKFELIYDPSDKSDKRDREEVIKTKGDQVRFQEKTFGTDLHAEFRQDMKNRIWLIRDKFPGLGDEYVPIITIMPKIKKKERV